jgi:hypothetical protein
MHMKKLRIIQNEVGGVTSAIMMAGAALAVGYGVYRFSEQVSVSRATASNESYARLNNDVVTSRLGHAVGSNAILCSEVDRTCRWNDSFKASEFSLDSVRQNGKSLKVVAKNCLPSSTETLDLTNCRDVFAEAEVKMVDFTELQDAKMVAGMQRAGDKDKFGALVSVTTGFNSGERQRTATTTSLIRRPRAILKVVAGDAICANTCQVVSAAGGDMTNNFCYGPVEIENEQSNTSVKVAVVNEGPGHVYRFQVQRSFTPNPDFQGPASRLADELVFDSAKVLPKGLSPGEKYEFIDERIPCFDERVTRNITQVGGAGGVTVSQDARNHKPSGTARYSFVDTALEPNNVLMLEADGTTVPATLTTTTVVTVISGMN